MGKNTFLQDFKAFAMKGNVIDMAVGVVIGGAFGKIVSSLVANVIMPPIGLLVGGVNFTDLKWVMKAAEIGADGKSGYLKGRCTVACRAYFTAVRAEEGAALTDFHLKGVVQ